jgi:hypothetical protein
LKCTRCTAKSASGERCVRSVCIGTPLCWQHLRRRGLDIRESKRPHAGKGLFAYKPGGDSVVFKKGEPVARMYGQRITKTELDARYGEYTAPYGLSEDGRVEDGACARGIGMLANHAVKREANGEFLLHKAHFWLFATRNIAHGDEILVNYGKMYRLVEPGSSHLTRSGTTTSDPAVTRSRSMRRR